MGDPDAVGPKRGGGGGDGLSVRGSLSAETPDDGEGELSILTGTETRPVGFRLYFQISGGLTVVSLTQALCCLGWCELVVGTSLIGGR